jgi:hypothetical protein
MVFEYRRLEGAIDEERNIQVKTSCRFLDDADNRVPYTYVSEGLSLNFSVLMDREMVPGAQPGAGSTWIPKWPTAYHVDESELLASYMGSIDSRTVDLAAFDEIKESLREGLLVLVTRGGVPDEVSPDFYIDFVPGRY